ncbi:MAG TPA: FtsW/RodA/SpoVE family cell cycle protein [Rectinemataceae bacterium]|nr:FtsW/RodA/SpoVE family cell cycle protein [Rectinemataceae bacterium]
MKPLHEFAAEGRTSRHPESGFAGSFAALAVIGFVAMWSASSGYGVKMGKGASYFAVRQAIFLLPAILVFMAASIVSLDWLRNLAGLFAIASIVSLTLPFLPGIGVEINGGRRWINLVFTNFQPSELWKPVSIFYAAHILDKKNQTIRNTAGEAIFPFLVVVLGCAIVFLQDDFSTSMLALVAALSVFWFAGTPLRFFLGTLILAVPAVFLMITSSEYRLIRVLGFIIPDYDPHGMNYQVQNSIRAIMSGGLWGKGLGLGTRKLSSIPEIQSDFVFAAFAEEMGLLGVAAVFACWIFLVIAVIRVTRGREGFRYLLAMGLLCLLSLQFLVNLGVVSGFLPATGIALPFFSAGGSSLLSTALAGGLILNALKDTGFSAVSSSESARISGGNGNG